MPLVESGDVERLLLFLPGWGAADAVNSAVALVIVPPWGERQMSTRAAMNHFNAGLGDSSTDCGGRR